MSLEPYFSNLMHGLLGALDPQDEVSIRQLRCAVLFVDIAGYTRLTYDAVRAGGEDIEKFSESLNAYFCDLIDVIHANGGDVTAFAGDAIAAIFPDTSDGLATATEAGARAGIEACALRLDGLPASLAVHGIVPSRVSLVSGDIWLAEFGCGERRHLLAAGPAFEQLATCHDHARPGTVVVDGAAQKLLASRAEMSSSRQGEPDLPRILVSLVAEGGGRRVPPAAAKVPTHRLRRYLSPALAERIERHRTGWMSEMRFVCAAFISLAEGGVFSQRDPVPLAEFLSAIAECVSRFGCELHVVAEEKGVVAIALAGTPGHTHEDDPLRIVSAASAIARLLQAKDVPASIGISTGTTLCGIFGSAERRDYVVFGEVMNLAARLMQQRAGILCDAATATRLGKSILARSIGPLSLKGFSSDVEAVEIIQADTHHGHHVFGDLPSGTTGRQQEKERIETALRLHRDADVPGDLLVLLGDPGMGKSVLAQYAVAAGEQLGLQVIAAAGHRLDQSTPYFVCLTIVSQLFSLDRSEDARRRLKAIVRDAVQSEPDMVDFISLLNDPLRLDFARTTASSQIEPAARSAMTTRLLIHLLSRGSRGRLLLVVDDAHWLDSASWSVIAQAQQALPNLLVLLTSRNSDETAHAMAHALADRPEDGKLALGEMSDVEIGGVVAARLGARETAPDIARFLHGRSGGNPFFAEQLALAMQERGLLSITSGVCASPSRLDRFTQIELPGTVRGAVRERIDRLTSNQQLLLKVASVAGSEVPMETLRHVFGTVSGASVAAELGAIEDRDLARASREEGQHLVKFRHAIVQDAAYESLTPSQKKTLHGALARWHETAQAHDLGPWLATLAHHFSAAGDRKKALHYLSRAGAQALDVHANLEAAQFLSAALALEDGSEPPIDRAERRRMAAEAQLKLSHLTQCRDLLLEALRVSGKPVPGGTVGLVADLCADAAAAILSRSAGEDRRVPFRAEADPSLLRAQLHQLRAEVAYFEHDTLTLLHSTFAALREAAASGPSKELAKAHGTAGIVLGLMGLHGAARRQMRSAHACAITADHGLTAAYVQHLAGVQFSPGGDWPAVTEAIERAGEAYRGGGDLYRWHTTRMILAYQALLRGDFPTIARHLAETDERSVFPFGPQQLRIWYRTCELALANIRAAQDGAADRQPLVDDVLALAEIADPSQAIICRGFAADALRLQGDAEGALRQARLGLAQLRRHRPMTYFSLFGIASAAATFLSAAERAPETWAGLRPLAREGLRSLKRFSLMVPIARPCVLLHEGRMAALDGRNRKAHRCFAAAARTAASFEMRGVEAASQRAAAATSEGRRGTTEDLPWA